MFEPNDNNLSCIAPCNSSDHDLRSFLADMKTRHIKYKKSNETYFVPFKSLISSVYHFNTPLHSVKLQERFKFLLKLVDFQSVKRDFQSTFNDFLHQIVNTKASLKNVTDDIVTRVASLKYAIGNVLQVTWPQLLKEHYTDKYINVEIQVLHIVYLLTAHFLPPSNSVNTNEKSLVHSAIVRVVYQLTDKFVHKQLNTTHGDLFYAMYNRDNAGLISLHNNTVLLTIDELFQST